MSYSSASIPLQPLGPSMLHDNVGHLPIQGFSCDVILPSISAIRSTALNLPPLTLPPFPPPFTSYLSHPAPGPACIPLPASSDCDLHHGPTIASVVGYKPTTKAGGSRHRPTPSISKALGKWKVADVSDIDSVDSGDKSKVKKDKGSHGGHRPGVGNYKDDDIIELLQLVEEELPIGGNGWKHISFCYEQWATCKSHPVCDIKALKSKFKGVSLLFLTYSNSNIAYCSSWRQRNQLGTESIWLRSPARKPMTPLMHLIMNLLLVLTKSTPLWPVMVAPTFLNLVALVHIKLLSLLERLPVLLILRLNMLVTMNELIVHSNRPTSCPLLTNCKMPNNLTDLSKLRLISFMIVFTRLSASVTALTWSSTSKGGWRGQQWQLLDVHLNLINIILMLNVFVAKFTPQSITLKVVLIWHGLLMGWALLISTLIRKTRSQPSFPSLISHLLDLPLISLTIQQPSPPLCTPLHFEWKTHGKYE